MTRPDERAARDDMAAADEQRREIDMQIASWTPPEEDWIDKCTPRTGLLLVVLSAVVVLAGAWAASRGML